MSQARRVTVGAPSGNIQQGFPQIEDLVITEVLADARILHPETFANAMPGNFPDDSAATAVARPGSTGRRATFHGDPRASVENQRPALRQHNRGATISGWSPPRQDPPPLPAAAAGAHSRQEATPTRSTRKRKEGKNSMLSRISSVINFKFGKKKHASHQAPPNSPARPEQTPQVAPTTIRFADPPTPSQERTESPAPRSYTRHMQALARLEANSARRQPSSSSTEDEATAPISANALARRQSDHLRTQQLLFVQARHVAALALTDDIIAYEDLKTKYERDIQEWEDEEEKLTLLQRRESLNDLLRGAKRRQNLRKSMVEEGLTGDGQPNSSTDVAPAERRLRRHSTPSPRESTGLSPEAALVAAQRIQEAVRIRELKRRRRETVCYGGLFAPDEWRYASVDGLTSDEPRSRRTSVAGSRRGSQVLEPLHRNSVLREERREEDEEVPGSWGRIPE